MKVGLALILFISVAVSLSVARRSWRGSSGQSTSGRWRGRGGQFRNNANNADNNNRRFGRRQKWGRTNLLQWNRQVSTNVTVVEKAMANANRQYVFFVSMDKPNLVQGDITPTLSMYDFQNNLIIALVLLPNRRMCVSLPTSLVVDFNSTVDQLTTRNKSPAPVSPTVTIGEFLITGNQTLTELVKTNPGSYRLCSHSGLDVVYTVEETDSFTDLSATTPISVLTLNGKVTIHNPSSSS